MAADGSLFWTSGAEILWVPPDNEVEEPNPTFSTTEYAIIDYVTDLPYVGLFSNPPITGTFAQGPLVNSADTAKGYLWIANDVYFVPLGDYLSKNYIPVNA
jgi:hypothetical protein